MNSKWTALKGSLGKVKWRFMFQAIMFQDSGRYFINRNEETGQEDYRNMVGLISIDQQSSIQAFMEELATPAILSKPVDVFNNSNLGPVAELNGIWCYAHPEEAYGNENIRFKLCPRPYPQGSPMDTPPTPFPLEESWVCQVWQPWQNLLKWYTKEEQFYLIAEVFGPDTVNYFFEALGDDFYTSFIPIDIRQKGYGRYNGMLQRSASIPGMSYGEAPQITPPVMPISPGVNPAMPDGMPKATMGTPVSTVPPVVPTTAIPTPTVSPAVAAMTMPVPTVTQQAPTAAPKMPATTMPAVPGMQEADEDRIGHMPKAPNLPPEVQSMMKSALEAGVKVTGAPSVIQNLGLPKVPTINLDDIVATTED